VGGNLTKQNSNAQPYNEITLILVTGKQCGGNFNLFNQGKQRQPKDCFSAVLESTKKQTNNSL